MITLSHIARLQHDWSEYAQEPLALDPSVVGSIPGTRLTAYGSEVACLRLFHRLRVGRVEWSEVYGSWYYVTK